MRVPEIYMPLIREIFKAIEEVHKECWFKVFCAWAAYNDGFDYIKKFEEVDLPTVSMGEGKTGATLVIDDKNTTHFVVIDRNQMVNIIHCMDRYHRIFEARKHILNVVCTGAYPELNGTNFTVDIEGNIDPF